MIDEKWKKYVVTLKNPNRSPASTGRLQIVSFVPGTFWLSEVSLFPATYKNRPNGNRVDLMEMMAEMHPAFLRFPGGNYLEGNTIAERIRLEKKPSAHWKPGPGTAAAGVIRRAMDSA